VDSFLAGGAVFCSVGPLEVVGSGLRERVSERALYPGSSTTGTTTRSRPLGERRPFRPLVPGRRRARLERRRSGSSACGVVAVSDRTDGGNPADLCQARGLADVGPPSRHRSGPDRGRTRDRHGTHPGGAGPPRGERGPSGPLSQRRPFSRRSCTSWRRGERGRPSLRWCGRGPVRDSAGVQTERPGERGRGRRRHHGVSRHPSATLVARDPGQCHEPGDLVPPDVGAARVAAMT